MKFYITVIFLVIKLFAFSQTDFNLPPSNFSDGKTILKFDLLSPITSNIGFSTERILSKNVSGILNMSIMPSGKIPFLSLISSITGKSGYSISDVRFGAYSFSPEIRFYIYPGIGSGIYIAPYYKYTNYWLSKFDVHFNDTQNNPQIVSLNGNIFTNSFGGKLGFQLLLGNQKNIVLDWSFLGADFGTARGKANGYYSGILSEREQVSIKESTDKILNSIPLIKSRTFTDEHNVNFEVLGPWFMINTAFSIGYRF